MKKLIYFFLPFCLWLLSISSPAQYVKIIRDTDCGLYKGETLMVSDSLYNKEGKLATPKYEKIRVLGFTEAYNEKDPLNKGSNFQKDFLYDILQDAADLIAVRFKGADGVPRYDVTGLKIEKVQAGYMADSSQLCYKAYLPNDICWFVSTKDAEKYSKAVITNKAEDVLDKSYREENDVYIVCGDNGRVVVEGIAKPFTIARGETKLADVSGKKMRFIFDGGLSFMIPFERFKLKGEPAKQEIVMRALIVVLLLLLILCLVWKYKDQLFNRLKRKRNEDRVEIEKWKRVSLKYQTLAVGFKKMNDEVRTLIDQMGEGDVFADNEVNKLISAISEGLKEFCKQCNVLQEILKSKVPPQGLSIDQSTIVQADGIEDVSSERLGHSEKSDKEVNIESIQNDLGTIIKFISKVEKFINEGGTRTLTSPVSEEQLTEPKKDDLAELKEFIEKTNSAIKSSITEDVGTILAPFIRQYEKPLSLNELKQNFDIEGLKESIKNEIKVKNEEVIRFIEYVSKERDDEKKQELIKEKDKLIEDIKVLQAQESNSSDFIKNGVKVEGCDSFIGFSVDFLSVCQKAEGDIYFRMKKMPVDEKVKAEPILSEYYQTRPTLMIEKWKGILATLKMCGYVSDALIEAKNSKEREKYMQDYFFKEVVRPYVSALLICLERFRTGEYINLKLDDSFVVALTQNIDEIIQICHINEIEVIYQRLFEELNVVGEQYNNYEIIYQKPDDKLSNWYKGALKNNLLLSVSEYAVNSITTKRGHSTPEKTKCTVLDV